MRSGLAPYNEGMHDNPDKTSDNIYPLKSPLVFESYSDLQQKLQSKMIELGLEKAEVQIVKDSKIGPKVFETFIVRRRGGREAPTVHKQSEVGNLWPERDFQNWHQKAFGDRIAYGTYQYRISRVARTGSTAPLLATAHAPKEEQPVITETPVEVLEAEPDAGPQPEIRRLDEPGTVFDDPQDFQYQVLDVLQNMRKTEGTDHRSPQLAKLLIYEKKGTQLEPLTIEQPTATAQRVTCIVGDTKVTISARGGAERLFSALDDIYEGGIDPMRLIVAPIPKEKTEEGQ